MKSHVLFFKLTNSCRELPTWYEYECIEEFWNASVRSCPVVSNSNQAWEFESRCRRSLIRPYLSHTLSLYLSIWILLPVHTYCCIRELSCCFNFALSGRVLCSFATSLSLFALSLSYSPPSHHSFLGGGFFFLRDSLVLSSVFSDPLATVFCITMAPHQSQRRGGIPDKSAHEEAHGCTERKGKD